MEKENRRLTYSNCSPPYSGGSGFRVARSPKGSHASLQPQFAVAGLRFAKPLYATAKRQLPITLCAIQIENIDRNNKTR
jgi:hypothetical protein